MAEGHCPRFQSSKNKLLVHIESTTVAGGSTAGDLQKGTFNLDDCWLCVTWTGVGHVSYLCRKFECSNAVWTGF